MSVSNEQQALLKAIQEANNRQTEELKHYINKELQEIKEEIRGERDRITELEKKYSQLNEKFKSLGKAFRKNNIIIFGLEYKNGKLLDFALDKLNNQLQLNLTPCNINNLYTVGKNQEDKPIVIEFTTFLQKQNVLKNCNKLKGTKIRIHEDLSIEERGEIKELQTYMKKARSANIKSYIKGTKLYINGKYYSAKQLDDLEELDYIETRSEEEENAQTQLENQTINVNIKHKEKRKVITTEEVKSKTVILSDQETENGNEVEEAPLEVPGPCQSEQQRKKKKPGPVSNKTLRSGQILAEKINKS